MHFSGSVCTFFPTFVAWSRCTSGFQIFVILVLPFTLVGVLLDHPAQMFSRPYIRRIVNMLHIKNLVRAIGIFLCRNFQTPELRKVCEWVGTGCRFCRRCAGQACGIIRQLADHGRALGIPWCGYSVNSCINQNISEPSLQHFRLRVKIRIVLNLPPFSKKGVHLCFRSSRRNFLFVFQIHLSSDLISVYFHK